jgi:hypothetical protein
MKDLESKKKTKPQISRRKEIIKIRARIKSKPKTITEDQQNRVVF